MRRRQGATCASFDSSGLFREILRFSAGRGTPIPRQV